VNPIDTEMTAAAANPAINRRSDIIVAPLALFQPEIGWLPQL
jgi:hypothetical protein